MKGVIMNNPVEARNMLLKNPQLAYALLQAQVVMRIVNPDTARRMLHPKSGPARPAYQSGPPPPQQQQQQEARYDERQPPAYPSSYNQPSAAPVQRDPRSAPPPAQAPVPSSGGGGGDDQEKQQLIEQVLRLTPEQINQLPEDQKQTILALKKSHGR